MNLNWRWGFIELLILGGVSLAIFLVLLPETLESTILVRRAERLRKLTGNELLKTQTELDGEADESVVSLVSQNIARAFRLSADPALFVAHAYITVVYIILYVWSVNPSPRSWPGLGDLFRPHEPLSTATADLPPL